MREQLVVLRYILEESRSQHATAIPEMEIIGTVRPRYQADSATEGSRAPTL